MENFFDSESIKDSYDIVIIGGGPAGATAAIYSARDEFSVLVLEKFAPGGQVATTSHVDNYPGCLETVAGDELSGNFFKQAVRFGAVFRYGNCIDMKVDGNNKLIYIEGREKPISAKAVIIATGCTAKKTGVQGENKFWGRGVSTCGTCDGGFYKEKVVVTVGGGNTALEDSDYLTRFASKVYLVHRRQEFRADVVVQKHIKENPKIELVLDSVVSEISGENTVESVTVKNIVSGETRIIKADGVFVFVGQQPQVEPFNKYLDTDEQGFLKADESTSTKLPGVFAAGDIRTKELRQIVTAVADGAVAAKSAAKFIRNI